MLAWRGHCAYHNNNNNKIDRKNKLQRVKQHTTIFQHQISQANAIIGDQQMQFSLLQPTFISNARFYCVVFELASIVYCIIHTIVARADVDSSLVAATTTTDNLSNAGFRLVCFYICSDTDTNIPRAGERESRLSVNREYFRYNVTRHSFGKPVSYTIATAV